MAVDKEVTRFVNEALAAEEALAANEALDAVPLPNPKPKRHVGFKIKSWRWVDEPRSKPKSGRSSR